MALCTKRDPALVEVVINLVAGCDQSLATKKSHRQILGDRLPFELALFLANVKGVGLIAFIRSDVNSIANAAAIFIYMFRHKCKVVAAESEFACVLALDVSEHRLSQDFANAPVQIVSINSCEACCRIRIVIKNQNRAIGQRFDRNWMNIDEW